MTKQTGIMLIALVGILFIAIGDRVLPPPAGPASYRMRTAVTSTFASLLGQTLESLPQDTRYDSSQERVDTLENAP
ncbi:hypothetical protein [Synechococcus sp. PCC 7336]|uniref:hypothetical protein n=1 Tax=Synechococcus sp. PCC 7336 TaxID=195250 RepID=UPI000348396C|nr:hypothetical protein [Synechococcus sp. PCC 7336]